MSASSKDAETQLPVQKQLQAYNARDIDAFMQWWADDCQYYEFPSRLLASGTAEIRERHVARFKEPNLHGTLVKRIAVANVVVDQETVTRTFPDGPGEVDVVAIHEVRDGKITKAWFKMGPPRPHRTAEIRQAVLSDAPAVRELTRASYAKWIPAIDREPTPMTVDYDARVRDHRIELLHVGGHLAALIELVPEAAHLLIENVAVLPAFQGQGHGRRLLAHAEMVAASLGLSAMRLYTNPLFAGNVQFYGRLGCGTHLLAERPAQPHVILRVATLDGDPGARPTMHIWTATSDDMGKVRNLLVATWHDTYDGLLGVERVTETTNQWHALDVLTTQAARPNASFLVASQSGEAVGHAFAVEQDGDILLLSRLYVLPACQGQGIGAELLRAAVRRHPGMRRVQLVVETRNAKALAFYGRHGFVVIGEFEEEEPRPLRMEMAVSGRP